MGNCKLIDCCNFSSLALLLWQSCEATPKESHSTILLQISNYSSRTIVRFLTVLFSMKLVRNSSMSVRPSRKFSAVPSDSSSAWWAATFNRACRALRLQLLRRSDANIRMFRFKEISFGFFLSMNSPLVPLG